MMSDAEKSKVLARIRKIAGQASGIERMVHDDRYCIDTLHQIAAIQGALAQVSRLILRSHIQTCVRESMSHGCETDRNDKIDELIKVFARYERHC